MRKKAIALAAMTAVATLFLLAFKEGVAFGARAHFHLNRDYCESKVREVLAAAYLAHFGD
jgi:hypothetical protein